MKIIHTELKNYSRRGDDSVSIKCDSLTHLTSQDIAEIDGHRGDVAVLVLTDSTIGNDIEVNIDDILKNQDINDTLPYKSPSRRLRGVLYYCCKQELGHEPTDDEFADFYKGEYNKIIEHYKSKLDDGRE